MTFSLIPALMLLIAILPVGSIVAAAEPEMQGAGSNVPVIAIFNMKYRTSVMVEYDAGDKAFVEAGIVFDGENAEIDSCISKALSQELGVHSQITAGESKTNLCVAGSIRAMPKNRIPPLCGWIIIVLCFLINYANRMLVSYVGI